MLLLVLNMTTISLQAWPSSGSHAIKSTSNHSCVLLSLRISISLRILNSRSSRLAGSVVLTLDWGKAPRLGCNFSRLRCTLPRFYGMDNARQDTVLEIFRELVQCSCCGGHALLLKTLFERHLKSKLKIVNAIFIWKMTKRCVVYGCSNTADKKNCIFTYGIPFWGSNSPVPPKRRKKLENLARRKRAKWTPTQHSVVCSKHFTKECFEYGSVAVEKYKTPRLKKDSYWVCVFPTLDTNDTSASVESERTKRVKRREVSCWYFYIELTQLYICVFIKRKVVIIKVTAHHLHIIIILFRIR